MQQSHCDILYLTLKNTGRMTVECVRCGAKGSTSKEDRCPWCHAKMVVIEDTDKNTISKAELFAKDKHQGQFRKRFAPPNVEYFDHLENVVSELKKMGAVNENILCAGWLHDTIEDTSVDYDEIMKNFNKTIADYVASVTKDTRLIKEEQERQYVIQLEKAPWQSKVVKLADIIANFKDLPNGYKDKSIQDNKVKNKIPYIMAIKSELVTRPETPQIESALDALNELLEQHNQDPI